MFRKLHLLYFLFFANFTISQVSNPDFYREDQFYFSIYYNSIKNEVDELKENKFSSSLNFGFIRDFPLNKSGKFSLGLGAGLGINSLNNNLRLEDNILSFNDNTQVAATERHPGQIGRLAAEGAEELVRLLSGNAKTVKHRQRIA